MSSEVIHVGILQADDDRLGVSNPLKRYCKNSFNHLFKHLN